MPKDQNDASTHDRAEPTEKWKLPEDLWCINVIAQQRLEEKTETAFSAFMNLLNRQPLNAVTKERLVNAVLTVLQQRFAIERILKGHIWMSLADAKLFWDSARYYRESHADAREMLNRYLAGGRAKRKRVEQRHAAIDEGWNVGLRTEDELFEFMKREHDNLIRKGKRGLIKRSSMMVGYLKYRREQYGDDVQ